MGVYTSYYNHAARIQRYCIQKKFVNVKCNFDEITVFVSLNNLKSFTDYDIVKVMKFLESITGQKPFIAKSSNNYVGSSRRYSVTFKVTLRNKRLVYFLSYLRLGGLPNQFRRYGYVSFDIKDEISTYDLTLNDWSVFYGYLSNESLGSLRLSFQGNSCVLDDLLLLHGVVHRSSI